VSLRNLTAAVEDEAPAWRQERRGRIVAAATELFGREPFAAVQMDDIARAAGVAKPTVYRYFPTKDALFLAATDAILTALEAELAAALAGPGAPEAILADMLRVLVLRFSTQLASVSLLGVDQAGLAQRTRVLFRQRRQALIGLIRRALEQGVATGAFRDLDLDATAPMIVGVIRGGLLGAVDVPPERMIAAATALVLRGAAARP
jgi:AcrR family transcriptional regulator